MFHYLSKPFSPHLTIYAGQDSSSLSILHRISGIFFLLIFSYIFIFYLSSYNLFLMKYLLCAKWEFFIFYFLSTFFKLLIVFHILNGLKFILWNFNCITKLYSLTKINRILLIILFFITIFI